jgi:hypothetical protein
MPFTESGLWVPRDIGPKKSLLRRFLQSFQINASVVIALSSLIIAGNSFWMTQRLTRLSQQPYLSYAVDVVNDIQSAEVESRAGKPWPQGTFVNLTIAVTNAGNSPAYNLIMLTWIDPKRPVRGASARVS